MCCRYEQIVKAFAEEEARRLEAYAEKFYDRVAKYKYVFALDASWSHKSKMHLLVQ